MNTLLIDALHCRNSSRAPVWLMRQAGRYMPEYRALREKYSFLEMCHQPELIAEITQQPIRAFGMDAAILFSDILTIPEALGVGLHFDEGVGPIIERPLNSAVDIDSLPRVEIKESLGYVSKGILMLKSALDAPLLGFCGAPFTMASYMIEGKSSRDWRKTKLWMMNDPTSFHRLLDRLTTCAIASLELQIDAGVDAVQVFDSWANVLSFSHFMEFSLPYLKTIVDHIKQRVPVILFCRGSAAFASSLAALQPHAISIDWNSDLYTMRQQIPSTVALQGNLDPDILHGPLPQLLKATKQLLNSMSSDKGYIFNLGHGITPNTPVNHVKALIDCVKSFG